jgi:hypothetical protein
MGTDAYGWLEIRPGTQWYGIADVGAIGERDSALFAFLFGIRRTDVVPLLPQRDTPNDVSPQLRQELHGDLQGLDAAWFLWSEVAGLDLPSRGYELVTMLTETYQVTPSGPVLLSSMEGGSDLLSGAEVLDLYRRGELQANSHLFRTRKVASHHELLPGWRHLLSIAALQGDLHGLDRVRFVLRFE